MSQREWVQISRRRRQQEQRLKSAGAELQAISRVADPVWEGAAVEVEVQPARPAPRKKRRRGESVPVFDA